MIRFYPNENFKEIEIDYPLKFRYAISDSGRLISFTDKFQDGTLLKGGDSDGYRTFRYLMNNNGKRVSKNFFIYKLVAELFIPKSSEEQRYVLHLDYQRKNDNFRNLKWATYEEMLAHRQKSPYIIKAKLELLEHNIKSDGRKLTVTKVIHLKKITVRSKQKNASKNVGQTIWY